MYPAWGGAPGAPAPGQPGYRRESSGGRSGGGNKQEHLKQAAAQRRKAEAAHAAAEQRRQAGEVAEDLFSAPRRTDTSQDFDVEKVMGSFRQAHHIINKTSCFGVDYQPATPAPSQHHVGEEEEDDPAHRAQQRRAPSMGRPQPGALRPPANLPAPKPPRPPQKAPVPAPPAWGSMPMAPPQTTSMPSKPPKQSGSQSSQQQGHRFPQPKPRPGPLKMPSNDKKKAPTSSNSFEDDDVDLKSIFQEMKHPYQGDSGGLPTPLTGIITPRVDLDEMGGQRHRPIYQGDSIFNPFRVADPIRPMVSSPIKPLDSPQKPSSAPEPPPPIPQEPVSKPVLSPKSSSSGDSSSDSESGETDKSDADKRGNASHSESDDDKEDAGAMQFGLGSILQTTKTSPGMSSSERSVKPTPSPRYPTPSPRYLAHPTPSPGVGHSVHPSPSTLSKPESVSKMEINSPLADLGIPSLLAPLSPLGDGLLSPVPEPIGKMSDSDSEPEIKPKVKVEQAKVKPSKPPVNLSTDDESQGYLDKPRKPPKKVRKPSKSRSGSGSERLKNKGFTSREFLPDDSDSEPELQKPEKLKSHTRSFSASPMKKPSRDPKKHSSSKHPSSTHSTPNHSARPSSRPSSTHSTPARERKSSAHSTPVRGSKTRKPESPLGPSTRGELSLSDNSDDETKPVPSNQTERGKSSPLKGSPPAPEKIKNQILGKMFGGAKASGGGKGKGKGKGKKGGITVVDREESEDRDYESNAASRTSPGHSEHQTAKTEEKPPPSPKMIGERDKTPDKREKTPRSRSQRESDLISPRNRENSLSWSNLPKKSGLVSDLLLSEEEDLSMTSPSIPHRPAVQADVRFRPDGRPSLLCSIPFQRLGKTIAHFQNRFRNQKLKKPNLKQECWITSEEERGGSAGRKRKNSENPLESRSERLTSARERTEPESNSVPVPEPSRVRHGSDSSRSSHRSGASASDRTGHRKSNERTHLSEGLGGVHREFEGESQSVTVSVESESRKRRERDPSPMYEIDQQFPKRIRADLEPEPSENSPYYPGPEPPPPDPSLLPPAHPTWPGCLMPPPLKPPVFTTQRVYYSYFERRQQDEAFDDDEENVVDEAKRLKHEADQETNMETKCRKYLQAIMMFSVSGSRTEMMGDKINAYNMYIQTLHLIKYVMKLTASKNNKKDVDIRLVVLSLRAQSLLNLRLYKMKRHELKDYQRTIQDVLAKSEDDQPATEQGQISPTPSPAGSEGSNCSKSSDYYSSGENRMPGVLTPPTAPPICLSIPKNVMQNQYNFCSYLSQCHELWEQADLYVSKGQCEDFFILLDQECGPLTLHSSLKDLVNYTRKGLASISDDKKPSGVVGGLPPNAENFNHADQKISK